MKIITSYVAYDGTEFETREECLNYEQYAWDMMIDTLECIAFLDSCYMPLPVPYFHTLEEVFDWFESCYTSCKYINILHEIPSSASTFLINYFGYAFDFSNEEGTYMYDYETNDWVKESK